MTEGVEFGFFVRQFVAKCAVEEVGVGPHQQMLACLEVAVSN
jgi:hypothetical protein